MIEREISFICIIWVILNQKTKLFKKIIETFAPKYMYYYFHEIK